MTHLITNGETTNGETNHKFLDENATLKKEIETLELRVREMANWGSGLKANLTRQNNAIRSLIESTVLSIVQDHLEELDIPNRLEDAMNHDDVESLVTERLTERDAEQDDAVDASAYMKIEDLESAVKDHIENYSFLDEDSTRDLIREVINNEVTVSVDEISISIGA